MANSVDMAAAGMTALVVSARTLSMLVAKGLVSHEEAVQMLKQTANEIAPGNEAQKAACVQALQAVFPSVSFHS